MKHYKNLMSALGDAMPICLAWRLAGTEDNYFNARDLFAFALYDDKENALKEGQFYVVSAEGAVGIASGYEYFVRWLFIPLEGETYDREVIRLQKELENDAKPETAEQPKGAAATTKKRFCTQCGTPLNPDAKFCKNCGAPVKR